MDELKPVDQGFCPRCDGSAERNFKDVIDSIDDEIGHECDMCEIQWVEVRQTVGYKGLQERAVYD